MEDIGQALRKGGLRRKNSANYETTCVPAIAEVLSQGETAVSHTSPALGWRTEILPWEGNAKCLNSNAMTRCTG